MQLQKFIWVIACFMVWLSPVYSSPNTINRYEVNCSQQLWNASFDSSIVQIGVTERTGKNDGYQVERYLGSVGLVSGNPYCYAGQYWSFKVAAARLQEPVILLKSGLASAAFNYAAKVGTKTSPQPRPKDLIFWKFTRSMYGHVGRIIKVSRGGWITTVEYNTSSGISGNQRDGGGVHVRRRNIHYPLGRMNFSGLIGAKQ